MGILPPSPDERVKDVRVSEDALSVDLMDGRTHDRGAVGVVSAPLDRDRRTACALAGVRRRLWYPLAGYR